MLFTLVVLVSHKENGSVPKLFKCSKWLICLTDDLNQELIFCGLGTRASCCDALNKQHWSLMGFVTNRFTFHRKLGFELFCLGELSPSMNQKTVFKVRSEPNIALKHEYNTNLKRKPVAEQSSNNCSGSTRLRSDQVPYRFSWTLSVFFQISQNHPSYAANFWSKNSRPESGVYFHLCFVLRDTNCPRNI